MGDALSLDKPNTMFQLYYQNVNGIKLDKKRGDFSTICPILHALLCDVVGLCKTKLDVSKYTLQEAATLPPHG